MCLPHLLSLFLPLALLICFDVNLNLYRLDEIVLMRNRNEITIPVFNAHAHGRWLVMFRSINMFIFVFFGWLFWYQVCDVCMNRLTFKNLHFQQQLVNVLSTIRHKSAFFLRGVHYTNHEFIADMKLIGWRFRKSVFFFWKDYHK